MVVCDPPDANEHKTQYIAEKFWRHRQQAVFQSGGNILVLHLRNVNFQYEKSNDDRKDSVAECLDPRSRHFTDPKNSGKPFVQIFLVFSQWWFGQRYRWAYEMDRVCALPRLVGVFTLSRSF